LTAELPSSDAHEVVHFDPLSAETPMDAWQLLGDQAIDPNPFFGPAFLCAFLEHMGPRSVRLLVVQERASGRWLLAAPLGRRRLGLALPANATWATEYAPLGTPLIHAAAGDAAVRRFLQAGAAPGGLFAVPYLPLESTSARRLKNAAPDRTLVLARSARAGHGTGAEGTAQLAEADSGKRRKEMRRLMRRLGDHGTPRFISLAGAEAIQGFEAFLHLEAAGWKGRSGTALLSLPETATFARLAVQHRAGTGGVRIDQLWAGDTLVAALVLFGDGGRMFSWKIAFDEDFARYSPGAQIALQALKTNLASPGFKGADSLAVPGHKMIEPLWRGRLETGTLVYAQGTLGGLKQKLGKADVELERSLRHAARSLKRHLSR
jgi:CelD/BcsL family acetyltransferase involved in cellulose biosynthesis